MLTNPSGIHLSPTLYRFSTGVQKEKTNRLEATINIFNQSMNEVSYRANDVMESMKKVMQSAEASRAQVKSTIEGIRNIENFYQSINDVIQIISDIADRVNLLSLNASIEAARAGEHGRGFAVVAEEISKLADGTATNVKQITDLINEGNLEVNRNRDMVMEMKGSFGLIMENITSTGATLGEFNKMIQARVNDITGIKQEITSINEFAENLSESTDREKENTLSVSEAIEKVNTGSRDFVEKSAKLAESSSQLNEIAASLSEILQRFML